MEINLNEKVNKLNEFYHKTELGNELTTSEVNDQKIMRDEIIDYVKFVLNKTNK